MKRRIKRWVQLHPITRFIKRMVLRISTTRRYMKKHGFSLQRAWKHSGLMF